MSALPATNCLLPKRTNHRFWVGMACLLAVLPVVSLVGCGGESTGPSVEEQKGLKTIAVLYGTHLSMNRGQPPASGEELKKFAIALKQNRRVPIGLDLDDVDAVFVSPRDGQPYVLLLGKDALPRTGGETAIAYEQTGADGKRQIALTNTAVIEVNADEFAQYVPNAR